MKDKKKGAIPSEAVENRVYHNLIHPAVADAELPEEKLDGKKIYYRMGVLCGNMLYYTKKFSSFKEMMQYCEDVDKKDGWDMFRCRFCFQAFKDDTYNFEKACFEQIEFPVNGIASNKERLAEIILKAYEKAKGCL